MSARRPRKTLTLALVKLPFSDEAGRKGILAPFARAPVHATTRISIQIPGWPVRPLRTVFLSDFHTGSHTDDVARLAAIVAEASTHRPELVLLGGDFMNMMAYGGGRVPPHVIARVLGSVRAPLGTYAVLGNHDYDYGAESVAAALRAQDIVVLEDESHTVQWGDFTFDIGGIPDARVERGKARTLVSSLTRPTLVLAHDPFWFAHVPPGPHLMLAGHTHGGQIWLPLLGPFTNKSSAPLRWTYGHIVDGGRQLYVTSGIGTSGLPVRIGIRPEIAVLDIGGPG